MRRISKDILNRKQKRAALVSCTLFDCMLLSFCTLLYFA